MQGVSHPYLAVAAQPSSPSQHLRYAGGEGAAARQWWCSWRRQASERCRGKACQRFGAGQVSCWLASAEMLLQCRIDSGSECMHFCMRATLLHGASCPGCALKPTLYTHHRRGSTDSATLPSALQQARRSATRGPALVTLGPGGLFGEGVLGCSDKAAQALHPVDVVASTPCCLLSITAQDLRRFGPRLQQPLAELAACRRWAEGHGV